MKILLGTSWRQYQVAQDANGWPTHRMVLNLIAEGRPIRVRQEPGDEEAVVHLTPAAILTVALIDSNESRQGWDV